MARQPITFVRVTRLTFTPDPAATVLSAVDGNVVNNDGATYLRLENTTGGPLDVEVLVPEDVDVDLVVEPRTYTLAAGAVGTVGTYPREVYGPQLLVDVSGAGVEAVAYSVR